MEDNQNGKSVEVFTLENNNKNDQGTANNQLDKKYKLIATSVICFCSLIYGLTSYIIGPALNDMKIKLNVSTDSITIVFGCMLIGYTLGAVINNCFSHKKAGIIFNYVNRQLVMTFILIMMACAITAAPYCPKLGLLFGVSTLCGFGGGGIDTAQVVWIIEMWADESNIYLSGYQFFFALGTFISPLMSRPYLANEILTNETKSVTTIVPNMTVISNDTNVVKEYTESRIEIPFGIVGGLLLISALFVLILHFYQRYVPPVQPNDHFVCKCPKKWKLIYISLGLLTLTPYVGMEIMNFQLIATFAHNSHLKLSGPDSATVESLMAGFFALLRAITFLISLKFWSSKTLYINFITIIVGNTLLFFYEFKQCSQTMLWVGVILCGSGFSSVFPSIYAFLETQFTISNSIGGLFVCLSGLMAAILPTLCGQFIEDDPLSLVYINYMCVSVICITFIAFNLIIYKKSKTEILTKHKESVN